MIDQQRQVCDPRSVVLTKSVEEAVMVLMSLRRCQSELVHLHQALHFIGTVDWRQNKTRSY